MKKDMKINIDKIIRETTPASGILPCYMLLCHIIHTILVHITHCILHITH